MVKTGNDEGTSMCGMYTMGNIGVGACNVDSSVLLIQVTSLMMQLQELILLNIN